MSQLEPAPSRTPSRYPSRYPVRVEVADVHEQVVRALARPGTWWTAAERLAIAAEARAARDCRLCRERKRALSPSAVDGRHDGPGDLGPEVVDVVHRIVTDPGRLTRSVYERAVAGDALDPERYVELVGVTVMIHALDVFARALGVDAVPLPAPIEGAPSRRRPATARVLRAWVPQIPAGAEGGEDWRALYGERPLVAQIGRALSLVPAEVRLLQAFAGPHYMELDHVSDPTYAAPGRALDRLQTELVASRVSAINECFY